MDVNALVDPDDVCAQVGVAPLPAPSSDRVGLAPAARFERPVHGLRVPPTPGMSGWYVWAGEMRGDDDFFEPTHVGHIAVVCPLAGPFLRLPPGWRFLTDGDYCDVWFDPALLVGNPGPDFERRLYHSNLGAVLPGTGVGAVRLGMHAGDVRALLGEPLRSIERDEEGDAQLEYPGRAYFIFDHEDDFRLVHILLEDGDALGLAGAKGAVSESSALAWLGNIEHSVVETEFRVDRGLDFEREHRFNALGVTLYVDDTDLISGCGVFAIVA